MVFIVLFTIGNEHQNPSKVLKLLDFTPWKYFLSMPSWAKQIGNWWRLILILNCTQYKTTFVVLITSVVI